MRELRHDPIQRRWVIISTERSDRPLENGKRGEAAPGPSPSPATCAFCPGNEAQTPPEILSLRHADDPSHLRWRVRVVPNKYPALQIEGDLERRGRGPYDRINGIGAHEVIIETPIHDLALADQPVSQLALVLRAYRERLRDLMNDPRFRYILIFKNEGAGAGASLHHSHSQLIATPVTPRTVAMELSAARDHFVLKERCIFCDLIDYELGEGHRIVCTDRDFVTFCPYASRFPFEMTVMPRQHAHDFAQVDDDALHRLARHLREALSRMHVSLEHPPYNFLLHTAPNTRTMSVRPGYWSTLATDWHWHIEILPRLTSVAGFEWGTGFYINPTAPEDAARQLREVRLGG
jgi:UDPglucose--hexose-1-phosphate uridylyltransferase